MSSRTSSFLSSSTKAIDALQKLLRSFGLLRAPRKIAGRRIGKTASVNPRLSKVLACRPELICRKITGIGAWEIALSAGDCCDSGVLHLDHLPLSSESLPYSIPSLSGCITVSFPDGSTHHTSLFDGKQPLIFKMRKNWSGEGRRIYRMTTGYFLVIAPKEWTRFGHVPVEPEGCAQTGFTAHYTFRDENSLNEHTCRFKEYETPLIAPGIELVGACVFDDSEEGQLYVGTVPNLTVPDQVAWARVGEEKRNGWKGVNFRPHKQSLVEALNGREGRFFLRIYDSQVNLLDSIEFRFIHNLKQILVDSKPYTRETVLMPLPTGHAPTEVRFESVNGTAIQTLMPPAVNHKVMRSGSIRLPAHIDSDRLLCTIGSEAGNVSIVIELPRIWWRLESENSTVCEWRSTPLAMTCKEFRQHARTNALLRIKSGRHKEIRAGFGDELKQLYRITMSENSITIPLNHFTDNTEISQRREDDVHFNVEISGEVLLAIQIAADPIPQIVLFTAHPLLLAKGQEATLRWVTRYADEARVNIDPGIGAVATEGSCKVRPTESTTYTITLSGVGLQDVTAAVTIAVASDSSSLDWVKTKLKWPENEQLLPFQLDGVSTLIEKERLLLSDDMGLGKTVQAIAAIRALRSMNKIKTCLVITPVGLLDQWRKELAKWAPELDVIIVQGAKRDRKSWQWVATKDVKLVGYETIRSDIRYVIHPRLNAKPWDLVVIDEAQKIKNRNPTSEAVKSIPRIRSWALTGTPLENHEGELASIMEFVDFHYGQGPRRYHPGHDLRRCHYRHQLRRKKSDVLPDLPPNLITRLQLDLSPSQRIAYDRAEREGVVYLRSLGEEVRVRHILELIVRLKQICNFDPETGASGKLDDIRERMVTLTDQGHKALVFSQYKSDVYGVGAICRKLKEFNPIALTGDIPIHSRSSLIERFNSCENSRVLIMSVQTGGVGLNLQKASYIFHMDRWWNPAIERQAEGRAHRIGQTVRLNSIKYTSINTIEERIDRVLEDKQALFNETIDNVSIDLEKTVKREEMLALFGLR